MSQCNNIQEPASKIQRGQKTLLGFELIIEYGLTLLEEAKQRKHNYFCKNAFEDQVANV